MVETIEDAVAVDRRPGIYDVSLCKKLGFHIKSLGCRGASGVQGESVFVEVSRSGIGVVGSRMFGDRSRRLFEEEGIVMFRFGKVALAIALLIVGSGAVSTLRAQGLTGQISGVITDSGGGVIPGATVTIKNAGTSA